MCDALSTWDEFERLRRMVPERADWHLHNWGIWRRGDVVADGYDDRSVGLSSGGISGDDAFEHLCEPADAQAAEISDAIIDGFPVLHRTVISQVYEASVFKFRAGMIETVLVEAAQAFWKEAVRLGLE